MAEDSAQRRLLRLTLVQRAASLDPEENLAALDELEALLPVSDVIVLPEASARDFGEPGSDLAPYAQSFEGPYATRLRELATDTVIVAGMFEVAPDAARPYNTLVATGPDMDARYRKIHLYDSFGFRESDQLSAGPRDWLAIDVGGTDVGLMTCYDLRFPELAQRLRAELILVPSAWVAGPVKLDHWSTLLKARAIENVAFVAGVGQPGPRYTGHSMVVSPMGEVMAEAGDGPEVLTVTIDLGDVARARETNPSLDNRRL
ncbi:MAG TPA: carbon-nitrogen hydrolase family protein [Marmoricola sp.]